MPFAELDDYSIEEKGSWGSVVVFVATCLLAITSIFTPAAAISIFIYQAADPAVDACQAVLIVSASISLIFLGLYFLAARRNEAVGSARPPSRPWHNACFVTLRFGLVAWIISTIATLVTAFTKTCSESEFLCLMQKVEAGLAIAGCAMTILLLSLLEKCSRPFSAPKLFTSRPKVSRRVSSFADDLILERSVSRASFCEESRPKNEKPHVEIRSMPSSSTLSSQSAPSKPSRSVLERYANDRVPSWGTDWTHLATEAGCGSTMSAQSSTTSAPSDASSVQQPKRMASNSSLSSAGESFGGSSTYSGSKAAPSSCISDSSHRSPLSVMRTVDSPDEPIKPDLRFFPVPGIPHPSEWNRPGRRRSKAMKKSSQTSLQSRSRSPMSAPMPQPRRETTKSHPRASSLPPNRPAIRLHSQMAQSYQNPTPAAQVPRLHPQLSNPQLRGAIIPQNTQRARQAPPRPLVRRKTSDCKMPGAFDNYSAPANQEDALDLHTRMIEEAIFASAQRVEMKRTRTPPPIIVTSPRAGSSSRNRHVRSDSGIDVDTKGEQPQQVVAAAEAYIRIVTERSPTIPEIRIDDTNLWS